MAESGWRALTLFSLSHTVLAKMEDVVMVILISQLILIIVVVVIVFLLCIVIRKNNHLEVGWLHACISHYIACFLPIVSSEFEGHGQAAGSC